MKKLVILRMASQVFFLSLFVYILWSTTYPLTGSIPPAAFFKLDPLLVLVTSLSERLVIPGFALSLGMIGLALIFGRFFCGWVCPLGASIDIAGKLKRRQELLSDSSNAGLRKGKFILLAAVLITAIFARQVAWPFDPIAMMGRFVSLNLIPAATGLINSAFVFLIRDLGLEGILDDLYQALKSTLLGIKVGYFSHSGIILAYFVLVVGASVAIRRLWCRAICPLGALYALASRVAPFGRIIDECNKCAGCGRSCRTGAIRKDLSYSKGECILCMDCVYTCPVRGVRFGFAGRKATGGGGEALRQEGGMSRGKFLLLALSSIGMLAFKRPSQNGAAAPADSAVIRPPAALAEKDFIDRCVRCGNCMKVCITNGLQPAMLESGYGGLWTPQLVPEIGYCEYHCTLCGRTCPTGAIPPITLERKLKTRLGTAEIDKSICIPYAEGNECIVCQEHCPTPEKAIALDYDPIEKVSLPRIVEDLCVGCGICQNKCPVRPARAVRVSPRHGQRTAAGT